MIKGLANSFESLQLDGGELGSKSFRGGLRPEVDKSGHVSTLLWEWGTWGLISCVSVID